MQLLHQLHRGLYTAFPICVLVSESRMWLPSAARWIKVNLEHIALIFKLYFFFCFLLQVSTSVKQQYHDNIRWIREAGRHSLVRAQPPAADVAAPGPECSSWVLGEKQEWMGMKTQSVAHGGDDWNPSLHSRILGWAEAALSLNFFIWKC